MSETKDNTPPEARPQYQMAAQAMLRDLMAVTLDELRQGNHLWHQLTIEEQDAAIARIDKRCRAVILHALRHLSSAGFVRLHAVLDSITVKDSIKVQLTVPKSDPARHELYDSGGEVVSIVLAEPEAFMGAHGFKAEGPQLDLILRDALDSIAGLDCSRPEDPPAEPPAGPGADPPKPR